jgi:hypothetical protein
MNLMQPLPLNQRLNRIGQHVVRARLFLDLWSYFEEEKSRREILDTMSVYNEFFRFTPHAYLATYVIYMGGVFDKSKGTISILPLIREVKAKGNLKAHDAEIIAKLLLRADPIAKKVAVLRHNAFAHRSAHISYDDAFESAAVIPEQLRDLTDTALEITNQLLLACDLQTQYFSDSPREAAEAIMDALGNRKDANTLR